MPEMHGVWIGSVWDGEAGVGGEPLHGENAGSDQGCRHRDFRNRIPVSFILRVVL